MNTTQVLTQSEELDVPNELILRIVKIITKNGKLVPGKNESEIIERAEFFFSLIDPLKFQSNPSQAIEEGLKIFIKMKDPEGRELSLNED